MLKASDGDPFALRKLLELFGPPLARDLAGNISQQWQSVLDAEDVMQVTYMEALLQIDRLQVRDVPGFRAWLRRIAENNLRDAVKELGRQKRPHPKNRIQPTGTDSQAALLDLLGVTQTTPSRQAARHEGTGMLAEALKSLPADYRAAVRMYDLEGRPISEVAAEMKRSEGAVHMLRARAHDRLRSLMGTPSQFFSDSP